MYWGRALTPLDAFMVLEAREPYGDPSSLRTRTQKILFQAEYEHVREFGEKEPMAPAFRFVRHDYGPFTPRIYEAEERLARAGLLAAIDGPLTDLGRRVLNQLRPIVDDACDGVLIAHRKRVVDKAHHVRKNHWSEVYGWTVPGKTLTIGDAPEGMPIVEVPALDEDPAFRDLQDLLSYEFDLTPSERAADEETLSEEESEALFQRQDRQLAAISGR